MALVPMTELEAVNMMLSAIGETPVASLGAGDLTAYPEASVAYSMLQQVSRQVQAKGLDCNTQVNRGRTIGVGGKIALSTDILFVESTDPKFSLTMRSGYLYDMLNFTDVFTATQYVNQIEYLAFTDLPEHVRDYVSCLARKEFQSDVLGSESIHKQLLDMVAEKRINMFLAERGTRHIFNIGRSVQVKGLDCNTIIRKAYTPDVDGKVALASNVIYAEAYYPQFRYSLKDGELYNDLDKTDVFTGTQYVNTISILDFEDLPEHVRNYVQVAAKQTYLKEAFQTVGQEGQQQQQQLPDISDIVSQEYIKMHQQETGVRHIHKVSQSVQAKGLDCNTTIKKAYTPSGGAITLPVNVTHVESFYPCYRYSIKDGALFDEENKTATFSEVAHVNIITFQDFGDLPNHVTNYIKVAAKQLYMDEVFVPKEGGKVFDISAAIEQEYIKMHQQETGIRLIYKISQDIQTEGLDCNTFENHEAVPDGDGYIQIAPTWLTAEPADHRYAYVVRGTKLYDKDNSTYVFTQNVTLHVTTLIDFQELPSYVQGYVKALARKLYLTEVFGKVDRATEEEVIKLKAAMHRQELNSDRRTMLDNAQTFQTIRRYW